jgi:CheY-like chemotaxis protein
MNARILVVDDSGFARRTLRQLLEGAGHTVEEAKDGHDALERYFLNKPDLVLLDMVMEGMNGMEVLAKLRELDRRREWWLPPPTSRPRHGPRRRPLEPVALSPSLSTGRR